MRFDAYIRSVTLKIINLVNYKNIIFVSVLFVKVNCIKTYRKLKSTIFVVVE